MVVVQQQTQFFLLSVDIMVCMHAPSKSLPSWLCSIALLPTSPTCLKVTSDGDKDQIYTLALEIGVILRGSWYAIGLFCNCQ